ncbi:Uncharacterized protein TCAP_02592 [Tolypocladium capitatum]|uniref:GPI anchored serine-threonine rich protein n=1 Tax=Tolypocladium capitatum TaxID=45235 RepID=A0A2K3QIY1_9HYPO|nr:Uncharacterized protein TCAP_02592 [Tolypocladium capitatum]
MPPPARPSASLSREICPRLSETSNKKAVPRSPVPRSSVLVRRSSFVSPYNTTGKMKFLVPIALLAAGAAAQDKTCDADFIVTQCLSTETVKVQSCGPADYDCLCAAYQAVATCYNNCPNDPRAAPARGQVITFCQNASVYGTKAQASKTAASGVAAQSSGAAAATTSANPTAIASSSNTVASSSKPTSTGAADSLSGGAGNVFVAVAGLVAALM